MKSSLEMGPTTSVLERNPQVILKHTMEDTRALLIPGVYCVMEIPWVSDWDSIPWVSDWDSIPGHTSLSLRPRSSIFNTSSIPELHSVFFVSMGCDGKRLESWVSWPLYTKLALSFVIIPKYFQSCPCKRIWKHQKSFFMNHLTISYLLMGLKSPLSPSWPTVWLTEIYPSTEWIFITTSSIFQAYFGALIDVREVAERVSPQI